MTQPNQIIVKRTQIQTYRKHLEESAGEQWMNIQESREWDKTWVFFYDWARLRSALIKLELATVARYFGIGVDVRRAVQLLNQLKGPRESDRSSESQNGGENG